MNPAEWLARTARLVPDRPALFEGDRCVADYRAFAARAAGIAGALRARGVTPGDRVAVFMTNRVEYLEILYGIWWAGASAVPINAKLHPREAAWIVENALAEIVFVSDDVGADLLPLLRTCASCAVSVDGRDFAALFEAAPFGVPASLDADAMLWLFYTSGTTGRPKGVMITAQAIETMTLAYFADVVEVKAGDPTPRSAPMPRAAGPSKPRRLRRGARHVVPESGGFDPDEILDLAESLRDVSMFAAPTMVKRLVDRAKATGRNGDGVKTIVYGGGPMYVSDIVEAVAVMGPRFVQIYGQGECPMCITALARDLVADRSHPRWRERLASVGRAQTCVRVRIADGEGRNLPPGEIGEILVQGLPVMPGYWRNPAASEETLKGGWLWTGDMGAMDDDGFLTLHDRSKDVVISGGSNIYPREVEEALLVHPAVREVAVVGRKHADWGEEVVAFVVAAAGASIGEAELDAHCLDHIARFKRPKAWRFVDELPKNNYGKVLKTALRDRLEKEGS